MADQPQYSGVTYESAYYKDPNESMADYMQRLAKLRASGVLGGGGMLDIPEPVKVIATDAGAPLGQVVQNRPTERNFMTDAEKEANGWDMRTNEEKYRDYVNFMAKNEGTGYPAWAPGGALVEGANMLGRALTPSTIEWYRENYPEMTQRVDEELALAGGVDAISSWKDPNATKEENKQGFLESIFGNPLSAVDSIVSGLFGTNTPQQAANIPVVTSVGTPVNAAKAYPAPAMPSLFQAQQEIDRAIAAELAAQQSQSSGGYDYENPSYSTGSGSNWTGQQHSDFGASVERSMGTSFI